MSHSDDAPRPPQRGSSAHDPVGHAADRGRERPVEHVERVEHVAPDRTSVVAREKAEHGGIKWGSAFFGWLTAAGTAVLLTALLSAIGTAVGLSWLSDTAEAKQNIETIGIAGAVAVLVVLFVAYYCGGYVAGRMARFDGIKQGLAVWLWALVIAIVVAIVLAIAGSEYDVLSDVSSLPRLPRQGDLATSGIITAGLAVVATLGGAILGGLAGMRFHRKVDRTGLGH